MRLLKYKTVCIFVFQRWDEMSELLTQHFSSFTVIQNKKIIGFSGTKRKRTQTVLRTVRTKALMRLIRLWLGFVWQTVWFSIDPKLSVTPRSCQNKAVHIQMPALVSPIIQCCLFLTAPLDDIRAESNIRLIEDHVWSRGRRVHAKQLDIETQVEGQEHHDFPDFVIKIKQQTHKTLFLIYQFQFCAFFPAFCWCRCWSNVSIYLRCCTALEDSGKVWMPLEWTTFFTFLLIIYACSTVFFALTWFAFQSHCTLFNHETNVFFYILIFLPYLTS